MADIIQENQANTSNNGVPDEIAQMMQLSTQPFLKQDRTFPQVNVQPQVQEQQVQAPAPTEVQTQQQVVAPTVEQPTQTATEPQPSSFSFDIFKEKFNFEKPEDVIQEIENLRKAKEQVVKPEIKFESETAEKIFKAIQQGKEEELFSYLSEKRKIEQFSSVEITKDNADEIIKLGMQLEYPTLTREMIEHQFKKQYSVPKPPVMGDMESEEDFNVRKAEYDEAVRDVEMSKMIAANMAKPKIEAQKSKVTFPALDTIQDEGYSQYLQMLEQSEKVDNETKEAYKQFTKEQLEMKVKFIDEANKINFDFQFQPDADSFSKAVEMVSDQEAFYKAFLNSDGSPNRKAFLEFVYKGLNADKMISEAIKQGSNERMKALLPDNNEGGLKRQIPQNFEASELDQLMQNSLKVGVPMGR